MTFAMKMRDEWKAGMSEGRMEGRKEGRKEDRVASLRSLIAKLKVSAEQAMDLLDVPTAERPMYRELLQGTH